MKRLLIFAALASVIHAETPNEAAYRLASDKVREALIAPRTAIFSELGKDSEASVEPIGKGVYKVSGFVDSQNVFGALLRASWRIDFRADGGKIDQVFYLKLGGEAKGEPLDAERFSKGLPSTVDEQESQKRKEQRSEYHRRAQTGLARYYDLPKTARFSTLLESDDQFTKCRELSDGTWESAGVVEYTPKKGPAMRLPWRVVFAGNKDGSIEIKSSVLGDKNMVKSAEIDAEIGGEQLAAAPPPTYDYLALQRRYEGQGRAKIVFENGRILDVEITSSTGVSYLDTSSVRWIKENWRVKVGASGTVTMPIKWKLPSGGH